MLEAFDERSKALEREHGVPHVQGEAGLSRIELDIPPLEDVSRVQNFGQPVPDDGVSGLSMTDAPSGGVHPRVARQRAIVIIDRRPACLHDHFDRDAPRVCHRQEEIDRALFQEARILATQKAGDSGLLAPAPNGFRIGDHRDDRVSAFP